MPNKEAVLAHAHHVRETEHALFMAHRDEIIGHASSRSSNLVLEDLHTFVSDIPTSVEELGKRYFDDSAPTLGTELLIAALGAWGEIDTTSLERRTRKRRGQRIATVLNDIIFPMTGIEEHAPAIEAEPSSTAFVIACSSAEDYFMDARLQAITGRNHGQPRISVYHDGLGQPLIFRKRNDESSGLTLVPLNMEGVTIPPGTIVGLDGTMNNVKTTGYKRRNYGVLATYVTENPIRLLPIRVSAWAYEKPIDRALFATTGNHHNTRYDSYRGGVVQDTAIDHFRKAAQKVMRICGTTL